MQPYYLYSLIRELNKYYTIRGYATVGHGQRHRKLPWSHMDMHGVSVWTSEAQCKHSERFTNVAAGPPARRAASTRRPRRVSPAGKGSRLRGYTNRGAATQNLPHCSLPGSVAFRRRTFFTPVDRQRGQVTMSQTCLENKQ